LALGVAGICPRGEALLTWVGTLEPEGRVVNERQLYTNWVSLTPNL